VNPAGRRAAERGPEQRKARPKAGSAKRGDQLARRVAEAERRLEQAGDPAAKDVAELRRIASIQRAILEATLDPTVTIDATGTIVIASHSVQRVFGWRQNELIGKNIKSLMPEPHASAHDGYIARYLKHGHTTILNRTRQFDVLRKDGKLVPVELSVSRVDPEGGGPPLFTGSFRDITQRLETERALRASEARFHAIFDHSFQYMGLLAPDGSLLEANHAALDSAGLRREDVIGKPFWDTRWWSVSPKARERLQQAIQRAGKGEFVRFEAEHRGVGDQIRTVDFSLTPVRGEDGQVIQMIPEGRDITELKRAQRTETAMLRALATVGESAAMLAHEIKNPITAVNLALRAVAEQLGEDHQQVLQDLVSRMQRLEQLMRRTLTFTKPLELRMATIDGADLVAKVVAQVRAQATKLAVRVETKQPKERVFFEGDRQLLEEVLTNLVRNAIEAQQEGGRIEISLDRKGDRVRYVVDDAGPGIPDSVRATLFQPFVTTKTEGTGLGLPFSKKVIEQHGGTIAATSSPLGGARFTIELPIQ
jgi:PAS domain S-box-containing protein